MLDKSLNLGAPADVVIYDLEDSVSPTPQEKKAARERLSHFLHVRSLLDHMVLVLMKNKLMTDDAQGESAYFRACRCPTKRCNNALFRARYG